MRINIDIIEHNKMVEYPILTNAPITEALIDIRVKLPSTVDIKKIESIYEFIKEQYPEKKEQKIAKLKFKPDELKSSGAEINGYRYITSDKKQIVQVRLDGFTFNRLHPYIKWEQLRDETYRLWQIYKNITSTELITRVALRYINNLNIPMPIIDFGEYLTAPPIVPPELPQGVSGFLNRTVINEPYSGFNAIITHALEQIVTNTAPIILDIDVFKYQSEGMEEKNAWEIIEKLRDFKNKIFFSSITDKLKEMYK